MGLLDRAGARLTSHPEEAEILVVNTCSFIDTAKQESVDTILEMARFKSSGSARKLIVAGCLVERYRDEIQKSIPEVDAVVGTGELESILAAAGLQSRFRLAISLQHHHRNHAETRPAQESQSGTHKQASEKSNGGSRGQAPTGLQSTGRPGGNSSEPCPKREQPEGPPRRRPPRTTRPFPPRRLAGRNPPPAHLSLRRNHPTFPHHSPLLRLHKNRRRLRPPLHLLRNPQPPR